MVGKSQFHGLTQASSSIQGSEDAMRNIWQIVFLWLVVDGGGERGGGLCGSASLTAGVG